MRNLTDIQLWFERVKVAFANQMIALGAAQQNGESYDENLPIRMQAAYTFINDVEWRLTNTPQDVNTIVKQIYKTIGFVGTALPYIDEIYNSRTGQFDPVLVSIGVVPLASETVYGRVRLSYPPLSILDPIAIGDNDPRIFQGVDAFDNIITEVSVDANGNIVLSKNNAATLTSSQSLILNQFSAPQSASMWISGNARVDGNITASSFIKTGGLSTQFLKADGSIDSNTYLTGNQTITLSGDISGSGTTSIVTTIGAGKVTNNMLAGSIASSKLIGTDIATVGTITSGIWNGTAIANAYIGTGIDATKIADGSVTNAEFQFINTLTSNAQTQLDNKQPLDADLTAIASLTADGLLRKTAGVWGMDSSIYLTGNQTITLSGEASGSGATAIAVTLSNSAVIGKLLTGYVSGAGVVSATDSILTAIQKLDGNISALVTGVSSVFGRTGAVTAQSGDYTTAQVTESGNLYFTNARARASISETITGIDYDSNTGVFSLTSGYVIPTTTSAANWDTAYANRITSLTTTGNSGAATLISNTLNIPNYTLSGLGGVPYTGATTNVDLGEYGIKAGYFAYDTTPTSIPTAQGSTYWDVAEETIEIIMNGAKQHIGLDTFYNVKNSTGVTIPKGTAVRFAGTDGGSGHLLIAPFLANGTYPSTYYMGITAEDIANGDFGKVMQFGKLRGINTSTFTNGDILYASTTVAGGFQTTAPVAPNNIVIVAAVVHASNNGTLVVRATLGSNINSDEGVKITSPATGQLLQLQASGLWENKSVATILGGTSSQFVKGDGSLDSNVYLTGNQTITLSGEASGSGATSISVTLANSAVIGKVLTGLSITGGAITSSDTILSAFGKVQNQINGLMGGVIYKGTYNASTNTPTLSDGTGTQGWYYVVSVAGTQNFGSGNISFNVGDWAIYNGSIWEKVDNTDSVTSVNGQIGAVVLTTSDITEGTNLYYTNTRGIGSTLTGYVSGAGTITAADSILSAIQKLNGNVSALVTGVSSVSGTSNRITVSPTSGAVVVDIASNYAGQNTITTVGTIGTGVWQGTAIADAYIASAATWNAKIGGSGTTGYIPKFTASGTIGDSIMQESGGGIGINGTATTFAGFTNLSIGGSSRGLLAVKNNANNEIGFLYNESGDIFTLESILGNLQIKAASTKNLILGVGSTTVLNATSSELITFGATDTGEAHIFGGSARVNGSLGVYSSSITVASLISSSTSAFIALGDSSGNITYIGSDDGTLLIQTPSGGYSTKLSLSNTELITFGATDTGEAHIFGGSARVNGNLVTNAGYVQIRNSSNPSLYINNENIQWQQYVNSSNNLVFSDAISNVLTLQYNTGNVGIGTTSPSQKLEVAGNVRANNTNGVLTLSNGNTSGGNKIQSWNAASNADGYLAFEGYNIEYGRFDASGNLGIGTASPSAKLDVNGNTHIRNTIFVDTITSYSGGKLVVQSGFGNVLIGTTTDDGVNKLQVSGNTSVAGILTLNMTAGNYPRLITTVGAKSWEIGYRSGTTNYELREDGTTRLSFADTTGAATFSSSVAGTSFLAGTRTQVGAGFIVDLAGTGNSIGIAFGGTGIYSIDGNGVLAVKNIGDSSNRWGTIFAGAGDFSSSVTATSFIKSGGTSAQFLKADGSVDSNTYLTANQTITLSGDVSGSGTTAITTTIGAGKVTNAMLAGSIAASKLIGTDITTVGTIGTGVWNGTAIGDTYISSASTWNAKIGGSGTTNYIPKFTASGTIGDSIIQAVGAGITVSGEVSATAFNVGNGQYFVAVRNSGSLPINLLGIEAGSDDTRLLITGDFNIKTGALNTVFKVAQTGVITINTTPTTSAGTFDLITRNTSSGVLEKVSSSYYATAGSISGTTGKLAKFTSSGAVGDSVLKEDGGNIYIDNGDKYIILDADSTGTGSLALQAGRGSAAFGGSVIMYSNAHATKAGYTEISTSAVVGAKIRFTNTAFGAGSELMSISRDGQIITNAATNTGEAHIFGGSVRANGNVGINTTSLFSEFTIAGANVRHETGQASATLFYSEFLNTDRSLSVDYGHYAKNTTFNTRTGGSGSYFEVLKINDSGQISTLGASIASGESFIIGGSARVNGALTVSTGRTGLFSGDNFSLGLAQTVGQANYFYLGTNSSGDLLMSDTNGVAKLTITQAGAATFSSSVGAETLTLKKTGVSALYLYRDLDVGVVGTAGQLVEFGARNGSNFISGAAIGGVLESGATTGNLVFQTLTAGSLTTKLTIATTGAATFSSKITAGSSTETLNAFSGSNNSLAQATIYSYNYNASGYSIYSAQGINYFANNVGIGTTSPNAKLHVQNGTTANTLMQIHSFGSEAAGEYAGIQLKSAATSLNEYAKGLIAYRNNGSGYGRGDLYFALNNDIDTANASLSDVKVVIKSNGNVLISTTTDDTVNKLQVSGSARVDGVLTANSALSDIAGTFALVMNGSYTGLRTGTDGSFNVDVYKSGTGYINPFKIASTGAATFSSTLTINSIANSTTDTDKFLVSDGGTVKYRTGAELLGDIGAAPSSGSANYIQNQFASAQTASMWVSGDIKTNSRVYVGTNGCYIEEVLVGSTYELRVVDSAGNTTVIS